MPPVTRAELVDRLRAADPLVLLAVLEGAGVDAVRVRDAPAEAAAGVAAERIAAALWWRAHSPATQLLAPADLDTLVDRAAERARVALPPGDAWRRLAALTDQLLPGDRPLRVEDLDPALRARLARGQWLPALGTGAAGTAAASHLAARLVGGLLAHPALRLLPLVPRVGPVVVALRGTAATVSLVSGPLGVVLALWSLDRTLGPTWDTALPLLLGVGLALRPGAAPVAPLDEAVELSGAAG
jgi:hypothetical protein